MQFNFDEHLFDAGAFMVPNSLIEGGKLRKMSLDALKLYLVALYQGQKQALGQISDVNPATGARLR